jgi:predicted Zn-dependent protease
MTDAAPISLAGDVFDGRSLFPRQARLELEARNARLVLEHESTEFAVDALRVSPRVFAAPRFVTFPNGWQLVCADQGALERLRSSSSTEGPVAWLERRVGVAVAAVIATVALVAAAYFFGLPRLTEAVVARIPLERERQFGEASLAMLDDRLMAPTDLDDETLAKVSAGFIALRSQLPQGGDIRLEVRDARSAGPNAFALPGGMIVLTDQLVVTCTPDESIAVLAHELGHVRHRHALRHVVQEFGVGVLAGVLGSDASSLSLSASSAPLILARAKYSQDFERQADAEGFDLMEKAGYSPELFASCLAKISKKAGRKDAGVLGYASTHPPDAERIARAHAAALEFTRRRGPAAPSPRPSP